MAKQLGTMDFHEDIASLLNKLDQPYLLLVALPGQGNAIWYGKAEPGFVAAVSKLVNEYGKSK